MDSTEWIEALFGDEVTEENQVVLFFTPKGGGPPEVAWHSDAAKAGEELTRRSGLFNCFVGMSLQNPQDVKDYAQRMGEWKGSLSRHRGYSATSRGIPGVWIDIDIGTEDGHQKTRLPQERDHAMSLVAESIGAEPTAVIETGGGLHVYWLFDEPWIFSAETFKEERARGRDLVHGLWGTVKRTFAESKLELDATWDLARVMRVPGTLNLKHDPPRLCTPVRFSDVRYSPMGLEEWRPAELLTIGDREESINSMASELSASMASQPAHTVFLKIETLLGLDPRLKATWERKRRDMEDTSPSGWDMSLASQLASVGFRPEEIVDAVRIYRDAAKLPQKHPGYYAITASRACRDYEDIREIQTVEPNRAHADECRRICFDALEQHLGVRPTEIIRWRDDTHSLEFRFQDGRSMTLPASTNALYHGKFAEAVYDQLGVAMVPMKQKEWAKFAQFIANTWDEQSLGDRVSIEDGAVVEWVEAFAAYSSTSNPAHALLDESGGMVLRHPTDGLVFRLAGLVEWVNYNRTRGMTAVALARILRAWGYESHTYSVQTPDGSRSTRKAWYRVREVEPRDGRTGDPRAPQEGATRELGIEVPDGIPEEGVA